MPAPHRKPAKSARRLSKDQWLQRSMKLLERRGPAAMTLDSLTRHLGVTTGSFYWHFKSHGRFLDELTDMYIRDYTYVIADHLATLDLPPREFLIEAMRHIVGVGLGGMDIHFRSLAIYYPRIRRKIRTMDEYRTGVISGLYEGMGYTGDELRMRVHNFIVLNSMEHFVSTGLPPEDRLALFDERVKLLID